MLPHRDGMWPKVSLFNVGTQAQTHVTLVIILGNTEGIWSKFCLSWSWQSKRYYNIIMDPGSQSTCVYPHLPHLQRNAAQGQLFKVGKPSAFTPVICQILPSPRLSLSQLVVAAEQILQFHYCLWATEHLYMPFTNGAGCDTIISSTQVRNSVHWSTYWSIFFEAVVNA